MNLLKVFRLLLVALAALLISSICYAGWNGLRTSGPGTKGWQPLICANGNGWQSCELPVNITLAANPTSLVATGQQATITATVTDYYGAAIANNTINWTTTDGSISPNQTITNAAGVTSITLTSSHTLGGTAVTAKTIEQDGTGAIWVPFIDAWVPIASTYTAWANWGGPFGCSPWSPDTSTVAAGTGFWQSANCWQTQIQYRQDRQVSVVTGIITNVGGPVALYQNIVIAQNQFAYGTKVTAPSCSYIPPNGDGSLPPNATLIRQQNPGGNVSLYDNGYTGITLFSVGAVNQNPWPGSINYNGYSYTVGAYHYMYLQGKNTEMYIFSVCKAPL
jgi:hypothetical protein